MPLHVTGDPPGLEVIKASRFAGNAASKNSPFYVDAAVAAMHQQWEIMRAVTNGVEYLRRNGCVYLPKEIREQDDPYKARLNRSALTPFTKRLIENGAGMILRRAIRLEGDFDPWWEDVFRHDVDGDGTSLDQYALHRLVVALTYGHSHTLVDAPVNEARNSGEERDDQRPYFVPINPDAVLGWRRASNRPGAKLLQFRYAELHRSQDGDFGEEYDEMARVIEPGQFRLFNAENEIEDSGTFGLPFIPLTTVYARRNGYLVSSPPLSDVAWLNITHYQRMADLIHSLHIAAIGLLVLEDYDGEEGVTGMSYAIKMITGSKAYWVPCDAGSFAAQGEFLERLENQMSHLGITRLLGQKFVAESADAKRIDQQQANSVLATTSMELEHSLNEAFKYAGIYMGKEPPTVVIDRDFDYYRLLGQDVSVLGELNKNGQIPDEDFASILHHGEWLSSEIKLDDFVARIKAGKAEAMAQQQAMMEKQAAMKQDEPERSPSTPAEDA